MPSIRPPLSRHPRRKWPRRLNLARVGSLRSGLAAGTKPQNGDLADGADRYRRTGCARLAMLSRVLSDQGGKKVATRESETRRDAAELRTSI